MKLALICNRVQGGWRPDEPESWGGGEECITYFARALVRAQQKVAVFYDGPALDDGGVQYQPRERMAPDFDAAIHFKSPEEAGPPIAPWRALFTDQDRPFNGDPFDLIAPCSQTLARFLRSLHPKIAPKLYPIPYGYEPSAFPDVPEARDPNLVLHASSPDRGLEHLLTLWPRVLERRPNTKLLISYGWELFEKYGGDAKLKDRIAGLLSALPSESYQFRRLTHAEVHGAFQRAGVWAYWYQPRPTFPVGEMFCLNAIKAQVAGAVPVVRKAGVLKETVWSGLEGDTPDAFMRAMVDALEPSRQEELRSRIQTDRAHTWDDVARRWLDVLEERPTKQGQSVLVQMPGTPNLVPKPTDNVGNLLAQTVVGWMQSLNAQRPWIDPTLGIQVFANGVPIVQAASPAEADAIAYGFPLEDAEASISESIQAGRLNSGTAVLLLSSYGFWRATERRRYLMRRDLVELFGKCPDFGIRTMALDPNGNGITATQFRYVPGRVGERDLKRVRATVRPSESLAICMIVRNAEKQLMRALRSVENVADQIVLVDSGSEDSTPQIVDRFNATTRGVRAEYFADGISPRWCFDCLTEHAVGEVAFGHRLAGFEYPRNQSVARAQTDWVLWMDADEELLSPEQLRKYLKPNVFEAYAIGQHHFTVEPPGGAMKIDTPVRLFRRISDGQPVGEILWGPHQWPTFHPGTTARFTGIVHEHPGKGIPNADGLLMYTEGIPQAIQIGDVHLAHSGYYVELARRGRFQRNWPLMIADQLKYPDRRLGRFLFLRDMNHHLRHVVQLAGGLTPDAVQYAEECIRIWQQDFRGSHDAFSVDAIEYVSTAYRALNRGFEADFQIRLWKPEISGEESETSRFQGRVDDVEEAWGIFKARVAGAANRWSGRYV